MRACDVADESATDAADPAAADNTATISSGATSIFEKTSSGAQGLSYTAGGLVEASETNNAAGLDATSGSCVASSASTQLFSQSSGARFWSLACVVVMFVVWVVQPGLMCVCDVFDDGEQVVGSCYEGHADKFRAKINPDFFRCCTFWVVSLYRSV